MKKTNNWSFALVAVAAFAVLPLAGCSHHPKAGTDVSQKDPDGKGQNGDGTNTDNGNKGDGSQGTESSGKSAGLDDVFFMYDDASLSSDARDTMSKNAAKMNELASMKIRIDGHCDERGTVEYNLALGQRRADAARGYIVNLGVDDARVSTRSLGVDQPFADGHDESAWSQNRRAHFVVINP